MMNVIQRLCEAFHAYSAANAFCIQDKYYTYKQLAERVNAIRARIKDVGGDYFGLVANDDLDTYASILAIWMEGKCYVPLHPLQPIARCLDIISQVGLHTVLDSSETTRYQNINVIATAKLKSEATPQAPKPFQPEHDAYLLFTSGSTGRPKGVPISFGCVAAFLEGFEALGYELSSEDRCLQMFDLTFDLSVGSYLPPLLVGACVYTAQLGSIKWQEAFRLLDTYDLTMTLMVPSVIHYLRPYLDEIEAPSLRYSLFCGEALNSDDAEAWMHTVPHAEVWNVYGPTENTIYCTAYRLSTPICQHNGIVCIGKNMKCSHTMIVNENHDCVAPGETGELCLAGAQLTRGYWHNEEKNRETFFTKDGTRWYLTGDLCQLTADGNIIYIGRKDSQVKIQGFRIELCEIDSVARKFYDNQCAAVAVAIGEPGVQHLELAIEKADDGSGHQLLEYLKKYLPAYMIPEKIAFLKVFPQNANNKIDRRKIKEMLQA